MTRVLTPCYHRAMRVQLAAIAVLCALATGAQAAAQEPPVGEFHVVPSSGHIGTTVTVSGDFDREITHVRFQCTYDDTHDEGRDGAHTPAEPSSSFVFEYKIPAELDLVRQGGPTRAPLIGECEFLAESGHQRLTASVPFTVTEAALPSAGFASRSHSAGWVSTTVVILTACGLVLVLLGWQYSLTRRG